MRAARNLADLPLEVLGHEEDNALLDKLVARIGRDGDGHGIGMGPVKKSSRSLRSLLKRISRWNVSTGLSERLTK